MLSYIKEKLLSEPKLLEQLLEHYGFANIKNHKNYLSFGHSQDSSPKSITIYLQDNPNLIVKDWSKNICCDIFNYIIKTCSVSFKEVVSEAKSLVGIDGYYYGEQRSTVPFGGFYKGIKNRNKIEIKTYDESILDKYVSCGNKRFLDDGISLEAQRYFGVGYSIEDQAITIPIYNEEGRLMGIKARINKNPEDSEQKYYYLIPCQMSQTLYGYSHNYAYLESADVIYIYESEKSVQQNFTMNCRCVVALGSSSISKKQCQMILSLNPSKVVFMMDKGLEFEVLERNMKALRIYGRMKEFEILYWKPGDDVPDKASASDLGNERLEKALNEELVIYED